MKISILNQNHTRDVAHAAAITVNKEPEDIKLITIDDWKRWFQSEHSPIRVIQIAVTADNLSARCVSHLRTHCIGTLPFFSTRREDKVEDPGELYKILWICNPQSLMNIARRRLCGRAHEDIRNFFLDIKWTMYDTEWVALKALAECLVPNCKYLGRCTEFKPCKEV